MRNRFGQHGLRRVVVASVVALSLVTAAAPEVGAWNASTVGATAKNVKINGGGSLATVAPGSSVHVQFDYTVNDPCLGCLIQIGVGWNTEPGPQLCVYDFGSFGSGSANTHLTAPLTKGPHYLVWWPAADFGCNVSSTDWYGGDPNATPRTNFLGRINVTTALVTRNSGAVTKISKVSLNGAGLDVKVAAGSTIKVKLNFAIKDVPCPGCVDQILVGWSHKPTPKQCIYDSQPTAVGVAGAASFKFTAPTQKGSYFMAFDTGAQFFCTLAWSGTPLDPSHSFFAHVTVK